MSAIARYLYDGALTVCKPVARSSQRSLFGSSAQRKDFSNNDPAKWTPADSEGGDEHASGNNHDDATGTAALGVNGCPDRSKDK